MTVIYAEKPDLGRKIAAALSSKVTRQDGYLELTYNGEPTVVTWGFGHMYTLQNACDYDEKYKSWNIQLYPFFPQEYKICAGENVGKQLKIVNKLLKGADLIVNATDAEREGELIFSYVMEGAKTQKKPVKRLWLHSYVPEDIRQAYNSMKDGTAMKPLEQAARARAIVDWSIGINLTIYATKAYRPEHDDSRQPISIGRVQTPTLAILVNRELAIRNFVSKPFWNLKGKFTGKNGSYEGQLVGDAFQTEQEAQAIYDKIVGKRGTVDDLTTETETVQPPKLYSLASLQKDASKRYGFTAQQTLDIAQELYEKQYITYPRTDSCCLPETMKSTVAKTLSKLASYPSFSAYLNGHSSVPFTKRHFNDKEVDSHFALIPTGTVPSSLSPDAEKLYQLIGLSLIRIAYPAASFEKTTITTDVAGYKFKTSGKRVLDLGWMAVDAQPKKDTLIPSLSVGESVSGEYFIDEGKTEPPSRYTDGTLITAMKNAGKDIDDDDAKQILKGGGIGTQATRAKIIETLIKRGYARREKKTIIPTERGIYIIQTIPVEMLKSPELTGQMELMLNSIETGEHSLSSVIEKSNSLVREWCDLIRPDCLSPKNDLPGPGKTVAQPEVPCPICGRPLNMRMDAFVGCTGYRDAANPCKFSISRTVCGKKLTPTQITNLLSGKSIKVKGMKSKAGKDFDATLSLDPSGKITFTFENKTSS